MIDVPGELSCKEIVEVVNDYLEGALPFDDRTAFELHLAYCDGCTEYLRQLRQLGRAAARLREEDLPEKTRDGLLEAFRDWKKSAK
jgi:anti-sigma factor RsiW